MAVEEQARRRSTSPAEIFAGGDPLGPEADRAWLRRITALAVGAPILFIATMSIVRSSLVDALGWRRTHVLIDTLTLLATAAFGLAMIHLIRRGRALLLARQCAADEARAALLEQTTYAATLAERDRIAREMHDSLAQALGAAHLRLRALQGHPELAAAPGARAEVDALGDLCHDAYADVREAIVGLREAPGEGRDLLACLRAHLRAYERQSGLSARLDVELVEPPRLAPVTEAHVLRIVQEALTNVRKHAAATEAVVRLRPAADGVSVEVVDDGRGFDPAACVHPDGFGLGSMRERAALVGADLHVRTAPGRGTTVALTIPRSETPA